LSDLGVLIAVSTVGYFVAGVIAGRLTTRFGLGDLLTAAMAMGTISLIAHAAARSWPVLILASVGIGFTGGLIDSTINAYVALNHGARTMNLLHASFGVGATSGPLLVAVALARGLSWRTAYVVLAGVEILLLVTVWVVRDRWPGIPEHDPGTVHGPRGGTHVAVLLGVFFLYVGLEVAAGQWSYSLLTQSRGIDEFVAGVWVASYWGGLTGGRLALGVIGNRLRGSTILGMSMAGTLLGIAILWWDPAALGVLGLPVIGLSLAGVFPTLVSLTPAWVGSDRSPSVIGYQIAASSLGAASLPWIGGRLIDSYGLEALGPYLLGLAIIMTVLNTVLDRAANRRGGSQSGMPRRLASRPTRAAKPSQS
jgi:fucose permease